MSDRAEERRKAEYSGKKASRVKDSYGYEPGDLEAGRVRTARLRPRSRAARSWLDYDPLASLASVGLGVGQGLAFNGLDDLDRVDLLRWAGAAGPGSNRVEGVRREAPVSFEVARSLASLFNPINATALIAKVRGSKGPLSTAINQVASRPWFAAASGGSQGALYGFGGGDEETGAIDRGVNALTGTALGATLPYLLAPVVRGVGAAVGSAGYLRPSTATALDGTPLPGRRVGARLGAGEEIRLRPGIKAGDVADVLLDARARSTGGPGTLARGRAADVQTAVEDDLMARLTGLRGVEDVPLMREAAMQRAGYQGLLDEQMPMVLPRGTETPTVQRARGLLDAADAGDEVALNDLARLWRGDGTRIDTSARRVVDGTPQPGRPEGRAKTKSADELPAVQARLRKLRPELKRMQAAHDAALARMDSRAAAGKTTGGGRPTAAAQRLAQQREALAARLAQERGALQAQIDDNFREQARLLSVDPVRTVTPGAAAVPETSSPIRTEMSAREVQAGAGLTAGERDALRYGRLRPLRERIEFAERDALRGRLTGDGGRRVSALMEGSEDGGVALTQRVLDAEPGARGRGMRAMDATMTGPEVGGIESPRRGGMTGQDRRVTDFRDEIGRRTGRFVRLNPSQAGDIADAMMQRRDARALGSSVQPRNLDELFEVGGNRSLPRGFWDVWDPDLTSAAKKLKAPITMNLEAYLRGEGLFQALREPKAFSDTALLDGNYALPIDYTGEGGKRSEYGDGVGYLDGRPVQFDPDDYARWRGEAELQDAFQAATPDLVARLAEPDLAEGVARSRAGAARLIEMTQAAEVTVARAEGAVAAAQRRLDQAYAVRRQARREFGDASGEAQAAARAVSASMSARDRAANELELSRLALTEIEQRNPDLVLQRDTLQEFDRLQAAFRQRADTNPREPRLTKKKVR